MKTRPQISRRGFLGAAGAFTAALSRIIPTLLTPGEARADEPPPDYDPTQHKWGYAIDVDKCIGCGRCVEACKKENGVALTSPLTRTWVERYEVKEGGSVRVNSDNDGRKGFPPVARPGYGEEALDAFFVPKLCNHCEASACTQVCPVGATFESPDGVTLVDKSYCIGCGYCVQACPYGTRFIDPETHTANKCNLCYHRVTRGLKPACVEVCPTGARVFGDMMIADSPVREFLRGHRTDVLKPHLGTKPRVSYAGLRREVH